MGSGWTFAETVRWYGVWSVGLWSLSPPTKPRSQITLHKWVGSHRPVKALKKHESNGKKVHLPCRIRISKILYP